MRSTMAKNRMTFFYILAFLPLPFIQYLGYVMRQDLFGALIPFYGFLLLVIKEDKLSVFSRPGRANQLTGLAVVLASFLIYYPVTLLYPEAQFYGVANYTVYLVGLFLVFFHVSALKESATTLYLIVAATSAFYVSELLDYYLQPLVPYFVSVTRFVLGVLTIPFTFQEPNVFVLHTVAGDQPLSIATRCIGIESFLVFAIIITAIMMEDRSRVQTKLLWSILGIAGTFLVNVFRVSMIFVGTYFYGFAVWSGVHSIIGYVFFILWITIFFVLFSKRETVERKLQVISRRLKLSGSTSPSLVA